MRATVVLLAAAVAALTLALPAASDLADRRSGTVEPEASAFLPRNGGMFGPQQTVFFGYAKSLTRRGARYLMRVDPELVLSGVTANTAALEDKAIRPGESVTNDYYLLDEGHRLLSYLVPRKAHVTVITNRGTGPRSTVVGVDELSSILKGKNPRSRPGLWSPISGFWIRVAGDRALALDQAYRP